MEVRLCPYCKTEKDYSEFYRKKNGNFQGYCKDCWKLVRRERYENSYGYFRDKKKEKVRINREMVWDYLSTHPCTDCGEADPVVLEFDHVRGEKKKGLSDMVRDASSTDTIWEEISKCEVRCANCHRRKTARQLGYWHSK